MEDKHEFGDDSTPLYYCASAQDAAVADEINRLYGEVCEIVKIVKTGLGKAIKIGQLLTEQKTKCQHGEWLSWLKANVQFSQPTAWNYMRLYENRAKLSTVDNLTEAYRLIYAEKPKQVLVKQPLTSETKTITVGVVVEKPPPPEQKPVFVGVVKSVEAKKPEPVEDAAADKPDSTSQPDLVEAKIAEMWQTYKGKTVTLGIFRSLVSDAAEIPETVSIVKDALSKFEPPAAKASEAKKKPEPLILSDFDGEREVKWEVIKPPAFWHADASARYKIRCDKCESDVQLGPALPLDGNEKALASCNCKERGKRVERELRKL